MDTKVGIEPTPMGLQPISPPRGTRCNYSRHFSFLALYIPKIYALRKKFCCMCLLIFIIIYYIIIFLFFQIFGGRCRIRTHEACFPRHNRFIFIGGRLETRTLTSHHCDYYWFSRPVPYQLGLIFQSFYKRTKRFYLNFIFNIFFSNSNRICSFNLF